MPKSIKLKNNFLIDAQGIAYNKQVFSEYIEKATACGLFGSNQNIMLNKEYGYGGEDIPLNTVKFNYGDVFELKNNKVYCNKDAIVLMSVVLPTTLTDGYLLFGGTNGGYGAFSGAASNTNLGGVTYNNTMLQKVNAGDYITLKLGRSSAYSNIIVYQDVSLSVSIVKLL